LQGDQRRRRQTPAPARRGPAAVLRHRAAGAGRGGRVSHPPGGGGPDRRPRRQGAPPGDPEGGPASGRARVGAPRCWAGRPGQQGSGRLVRGPERPGLVRQVVRFGLAGLVSTAAYTLLYLALVLRGGLAPAWANAAALLVTAIANTAANRSITFGVRGG